MTKRDNEKNFLEAVIGPKEYGHQKPYGSVRPNGIKTRKII